MPEPLKNLYNRSLIANLGGEISKYDTGFSQPAFEQAVFNKEWPQKKLKQRMRHIAECLHQHLPANYKKAITILKPVSEKFNGFEHMYFQDFVECYGMDDYETSMFALQHFTKHASSEFAVRAFILQDEIRMMKQMQQWAHSDNHHVRRLASEGCRPRLPWAISLPAFKKNPQPVLTVLASLMLDDSEYVRRSVANNLNDISKDNPDVVLNWAHKWQGENDNTDRLLKHACRSLLKQGDANTMVLFGFATPENITISEFKVQSEVTLGNSLAFSFLLKRVTARSDHIDSSDGGMNQAGIGRCRIEFAIHFVKASGHLSRKVFKISESNETKNEKRVTKNFSFKAISTRKYYTGKHQLTLIINGVDLANKDFDLII